MSERSGTEVEGASALDEREAQHRVAKLSRRDHHGMMNASLSYSPDSRCAYAVEDDGYKIPGIRSERKKRHAFASSSSTAILIGSSRD